MHAITPITAPTATPVTLEEAKAHLRIDGTLDDTLIQGLLFAATDVMQNYLQRQLMQAVYEVQLSTWPLCNSFLTLLRAPLVGVESIKYFNTDNVEQTLDAAEYEVYTRKVPGFIRFINENPPLFDRLDAITVRFTAGYGAPADDAVAQAAAVPDAIKAAIKLQLGHLFENRQDEIVGASVSQLYNGSERVAHPYRLYL